MAQYWTRKINGVEGFAIPVVYHEAKSISYLLILKRQRAESLPVGCFTACHGASLDNCNPELASSAIAIVCIHDVIDY